jgi:heat shock protein HslJ
MTATFLNTLNSITTLLRNILPVRAGIARYFLLAVGLAWLIASGCGQPKTADTTPALAPSPLNGTWVTRDMYAPEKSFEALFPARPIVTFDLDKGLISGMSGCNQYMGKVSVNGQAISLPSDLAVTTRACAQGMEGEAIFLDLLRKANHWTMYNDGQLHLLINDMTVLWLERTK